MTRSCSALAWVLAALPLACGGAAPALPDPGTIPFEPERPAPATTSPTPIYTGPDEDVRGAQLTYPTGLDLHRKLVMRTCSGSNGVCHNQKEYPDLHTEATFLEAIGAPCNVQSGNWTGVFNRCERLGDRIRFAEPALAENEIGWFELIPGETPQGAPPDASTPGLHLYVHDAVPGTQARMGTTGTFVRNFVNDAGNVQALAFASYRTQWWVLDDPAGGARRQLFAEVSAGQRDTVEGLAASGIVQGDQNRDGTYGARTGTRVPLINPGKPEESYLVARLRGRMGTQSIPGTRMPLANQPPSVRDMLALMCFIEGLDPAAGQWSLESSIDYTRCSYSADPRALNLAGEGASWSTGVLPILQSYCGGCHGGDSPQAGLNLLGDSHDVYLRLMKPSSQQPTLALVQPGSLAKSYLWLKLSGDGSITGARMPIRPLDGNSALPADALNNLQQWMEFGASER